MPPNEYLQRQETRESLDFDEQRENQLKLNPGPLVADTTINQYHERVQPTLPLDKTKMTITDPSIETLHQETTKVMISQAVKQNREFFV